MAYKNLVALTTTNRAEVFKRMRDFMCAGNGTGNYSYDYSGGVGIGWTWNDADYTGGTKDAPVTNNWYVLYSPGESGNEDLYFKFTYVADNIKVQGYQYWNASTHVGVQAYNTANNWYMADADVPILWIYGDLNQVIGIARRTSVHTDFYPVIFGKATTRENSEVAVCASSLSSGSAVSIAVTVPTHWYIGQNIFIRDTVNIAKITIIDIPDSGHITANLATNYLAGCKLSADVGYFCQGSAQFAAGIYWLIDHAGAKNTSVGYWYNPCSIEAMGYPEILNNVHLFPEWYSATVAAGFMGWLRNCYKRHTSGTTALNTYTIDGTTQGRAFYLYNQTGVIIKEV